MVRWPQNFLGPPPHGSVRCPGLWFRSQAASPGRCCYIWDGFCSRWLRVPTRCLVTGAFVAVAVGVGVAATGDGDVVGTGVAVAGTAVCWVTLNVAAIATPFPSRVTVNGLVSPKVPQARLVKDMLALFARKVSRLLPTAATGVPPVASSAWLLFRKT